MSHLKAVKAGMDLLTWDATSEEWQRSMQLRHAFLERRLDAIEPEGLAYAELIGQRKQLNVLEHRGPLPVLFTSTGVQVGREARRWRSTWFQLSHIKIVRAGWEVLVLKWLHLWGITAREMTIPLPEGAAKHVAEMADVILERNPFQSKVEIVDEEATRAARSEAE